MHSHSHTHSHGPATGSVLRWSLVATSAFVLVELFAGVRAHSLALISDAGHNFTDALALLLAWFGFYLQSKPADETKTYGYHRASVLSAFLNALTLVALSVWIFYESALRLRHPAAVQENVMMAVAERMSGEPLGPELRPMVKAMGEEEHRVLLRCRPYATFVTPPRHLHRNDQEEPLTHWVSASMPWDASDSPEPS